MDPIKSHFFDSFIICVSVILLDKKKGYEYYSIALHIWYFKPIVLPLQHKLKYYRPKLPILQMQPQ